MVEELNELIVGDRWTPFREADELECPLDEQEKAPGRIRPNEPFWPSAWIAYRWVVQQLNALLDHGEGIVAPQSTSDFLEGLCELTPFVSGWPCRRIDHRSSGRWSAFFP
jgi:hypothetical protein